MKKIYLFLSLFLSLNIYSQIEFNDVYVYDVKSNPSNFELVDFDSDNDLDVVVLSGGSKINLYLNEDGFFFERQTLLNLNSENFNSISGKNFIKVVDLNNDGFLDVLTDGLHKIVLFLNDGNNNFSEIVIGDLTCCYSYINAEIDDIDDDGQLDIIAEYKNGEGSTVASNVSWFHNINLEFYPYNLNYSINHPLFFDFDNDDDLDVIYEGYNNYLILSENIDGSLNNQTILSTDTYDVYSKIICGDINNDGLSDILFYEPHSNLPIVFLIQNSEGDFVESIKPFGAIDYVSLIDYNQDGYLDLFLNKEWSGTLNSSRVYLNDNLEFSQYILINEGIEFNPGSLFYESHDRIEYVDINDDSQIDFVFFNNDRVGLLERGLGNEFNSKIISDSKGDIEVCDFDSDGDIDIIGRNVWFENLGNLNFDWLSLNDKDNFIQNYSISCGDINNDGDQDILINRDYFDIENSQIVDVIQINTILNNSKLIDFDNDNDLDVLGYNFNMMLKFKNNSDGSSFILETLFDEMSYQSSEDEYYFITDIDDDDDLDFILSYLSSTSIQLNEDGLFTELDIGLNFLASFNTFSAIDMNNDGFVDIVGSQFSDLSVFYNDGNNNFNEVNITDDNLVYISPTLSDMDEDGDEDIITWDKSNKRTVIFLNDNGIYSKHNVGDYISPYYLTEAPTYKIKDFDNDSDKDILLSYNDLIIIYENNLNNLSVIDVNNIKSKVIVYPNPASNSFSIKTSGENLVKKIEIFDLTGKIYNTLLKSNNINIQHLKSGIYLVKIYTAKGVSVLKLLKH